MIAYFEQKTSRVNDFNFYNTYSLNTGIRNEYVMNWY